MFRYLSQNSLSGTIPLQLAKLSALSDLFGNSMRAAMQTRTAARALNILFAEKNLWGLNLAQFH